MKTRLVLLDLSHNKLGDGAASALSKALKVNTAIALLVLSKNRISSGGASTLSETLNFEPPEKYCHCIHIPIDIFFVPLSSSCIFFC